MRKSGTFVVVAYDCIFLTRVDGVLGRERASDVSFSPELRLLSLRCTLGRILSSSSNAIKAPPGYPTSVKSCALADIWKDSNIILLPDKGDRRVRLNYSSITKTRGVPSQCPAIGKKINTKCCQCDVIGLLDSDWLLRFQKFAS